MSEKIKFKKLHENAQLPKYQTKGAIAFDLHSVEDVVWEQCNFQELALGDKSLVSTLPYSANFIMSRNIPVFTAVISTGLAIELPDNTGMFLYPRSGWGFNHNIGLANGTGLIDSDYRGEIKIKLIAIAPNKLPKIEAGSRVAQATISKVEKLDFYFVDELNETQRGENGFGHTGH